MKKIILIMLLHGLSISAQAQHCGWDGVYAIIVDVRDSLTNKVINDLDIILTDSTGKPYTSEWNLRNYQNYSIYQKTDTLTFGQNVNKDDPENNAYAIPFGINSYMLFVYANNYPNLYENGHDKIIIRDKNGRYESKVIDEIKIIHLCTSNQIWHNKKVLDQATTKIKMNKAN